MKTRSLQNYSSTVGCEVYDVDFSNQEEILELGKLVADQCIVYINAGIDIPQLYNVMTSWGDDSRSIIHNYVSQRRLKGRHWREIMLQLGYTNRVFDKYGEEGKKLKGALSMVSNKRDKDGHPEGIFPEGELDWHADQISRDDAQRIIGLMSVSNSENSQTAFLCTYDAYENLSSDMKSTIKELVCKHKWRSGQYGFCPGMDQSQLRSLRYNSLPIDGMETKLYAETVTGRPGIKLPHHSFDGFVGMGLVESQKIINEIEKSIYKEKYMWTHDWQDGQMVFMDQQITLHKRPTDIKSGNKRELVRAITYLNKIFPHIQPNNLIRYKGNVMTDEQFAKIVDQDRLEKFEMEQRGEYAPV